ncbi:flagellar hook protein FlgE [Skermanella sp. TT6]|uniref:Flagellar hook protein FlgE n=1 Tax=Skermanella cutis TaxID=2775420 RepID=A0ABX7B3Z5_9PROT|nr:flagellar hook protein FlgE [Skermanella sp. TT6]QQP88838.1 flagellar hook protein FlgE [Skermanella sp. TT6]
MSLFGSLFTGVSALSAQSQSMSMIANNISNVNTVGYKRNEAAFSSLVTQASRSTVYSPGGVRASTEQTVNQQGILQQSASSTDVAISGSGFFVVQASPNGSSTQETLYTRAGSFSEDENGFLRNSNGYYLMGWEIGDDGQLVNATADVASLTPVSVGFESGRTKQTTRADVVLNLDARQNTGLAGPHFSRSMTVYDSLGQAQQLALDFTATATPNTWTLGISDPAGGALATPTSAMTLVFGTNGKIDRVATQAANPTDMVLDPAGSATGSLRLNLTDIDWANNSDATQDITIDISGFTQSASDYSVGTINQDGAELGLRTGISIDADGNVVASFSNGLTQNLARVPVATFTNPNGLQERSGNVYIQTSQSGAYNLREAGTAGAGKIATSSLEASNVDLADEFSRMIVTQRAYSAGTKIISTADQMLTELLQLR